MGVCPKCKSKQKYKFTGNLYKIKDNKFRCYRCNTKLNLTKRTNRINYIIAITPLILNIFWGNEIMNFITKFTDNRKVSEWVWIILIAMWGFIMYNSIFSWSQFEEDNK